MKASEEALSICKQRLERAFEKPKRIDGARVFRDAEVREIIESFHAMVIAEFRLMLRREQIHHREVYPALYKHQPSQPGH